MKKKPVSFLFAILAVSLSNITFAEMNDTRIQGFISQGYLQTEGNSYYGDTEDGSFQFNEMGINFTTIVTDKLHLGIQFFARDFGRFDNDQINVSWAYGDYKFKHYLGLRAGLMKLSYGLYNEIRDLDFLRPNILYPNGVYNESWREILSSVKGIGLYGTYQLGSIGRLNYTAQAGTINIGTESGASELIEDIFQASVLTKDAQVTDVNMDHTYACSIFVDSFMSVKGLKSGLSFLDLEYSNHIESTAFTSDLNFKIDSSIISIEYSANDFTLSSEYKLLTNRSVDKVTGQKSKIPSMAYYGSLSYSFTDWFEGYICYSKYYADKNDKSGKLYEGRTQQGYRGWLEEIAIALRFDINDNWNLKFEAHFNDGVASLLKRDQGEPVISDSGDYKYPFNKRWELYAVKLSYNF